MSTPADYRELVARAWDRSSSTDPNVLIMELATAVEDLYSRATNWENMALFFQRELEARREQE